VPPALPAGGRLGDIPALPAIAGRQRFLGIPSAIGGRHAVPGHLALAPGLRCRFGPDPESPISSRGVLVQLQMGRYQSGPRRQGARQVEIDQRAGLILTTNALFQPYHKLVLGPMVAGRARLEDMAVHGSIERGRTLREIGRALAPNRLEGLSRHAKPQQEHREDAYDEKTESRSSHRDLQCTLHGNNGDARRTLTPGGDGRC